MAPKPTSFLLALCLVLSYQSVPSGAAPTTEPSAAPALAVHLSTSAESATTVAPAATTAPPSTIKVTITETSMVAPAAVVGSEDPLSNFTAYLTPICKSADKITPKKLATIQAQLKQFVELTGNKLALCFMDSYHFDPAAKLATSENLLTVCKSRDLLASAKGSYRAFQECAVKNWAPAIDKELSRVLSKRLNCAMNHPHSKEDPTAVLSHDEEQLIDEIFGRGTNDGGNNLLNNPNVKFVDVSGINEATPAAAATGAPAGDAASAPSSHAKVVHPTNATKLLTDPNTMLVIIESPPNQPSTAAPAPAVIAPTNTTVTTSITTITTTNSTAPVGAAPSTTPAPIVTIELASSAAPATTTTAAPSSVQISVESADGLKSAKLSVGSTTAQPATSSTSAPSTIPSIASELTKDVSLRVHHSSATSTTAAPSTSAPSSVAPTASVQITVHQSKETSAKSSTEHTTNAPTTAPPTTAAPAKAVTVTVHHSTVAPSTAAPTASASPTAAPTTSVQVTVSSGPGAATSNATTTATPSTAAPTKAVSLSTHHPSAAPSGSAHVVKHESKVSSEKPSAGHSTAAPTTGAPTADGQHTVVDVSVHLDGTSKKSPEAPTGHPSTTGKPTSGPKVEVVVEAPPSDHSSTTTTAKPDTSTVEPTKPADSIAVKVKTKKHEIVKTVHSSQPAGHDSKLHQIEHERQMATDPVSHLLKHKKYELEKQRKLKAVAELAGLHSSTTTAKPT